MIGQISKAFVESLRASMIVDTENISVVLANDNGEGTVNTALPAIAINVLGINTETGPYIGGLINNRFRVQVIVITEFANQAASQDNDHQYDLMDLSYKVMLVLNKSMQGPYFADLRQKYNFSAIYRGVETEVTRAMQRDLGERDVFVHRLFWDVNMLSTEILDDRGSGVLPEGGIKLDCQSGTVKVGELPPIDPNKADSWK